MQDNDKGFRPLELAANLAVFGLFRDIFETKDVYKTCQLYDGIYCKELYDVTEQNMNVPFPEEESLNLPFDCWHISTKVL